MRTVRRFVSLAVCCGIAATALTIAPASGEEAKPQAPAKAAQDAKPVSNDPLATVNGTPITKAEIDRAVKVFLTQNRGMQPTADQLKQLNDAALDQMISAEVLYQSGLKFEPKDIDQQVEKRIQEGKKKFPSQAEFENALKSSGITEKELKELTRKDLIIKNFVEQQIGSKVAVAEKDVEKFYNDNIDKFKKEESVRASHILIGVGSSASEDEKKKAKEKAEDLLKKVKAGEDFAALAKANSTCPSSAQGGDLGSFGKGQMVPPFEKAAFALKPGEVSSVVETQFGYHIIKLTEKQEAEAAKLAEVKGKIQEHLKTQKLQQAVGEFLKEQKGKMKIERVAAK